LEEIQGVTLLIGSAIAEARLVISGAIAMAMEIFNVFCNSMAILLIHAG
jgi:hypothetical protein